MCHLLLFMPLIGLPMLWLLPLQLSAPLYALLALVSGTLYWLIARSMRKAPQTGAESLPGTEAEVVAKVGPGHLAQYLVRSQGELWSARCPQVLHPGETVRVAAVDGISLLVEHTMGGPKLRAPCRGEINEREVK